MTAKPHPGASVDSSAKPSDHDDDDLVVALAGPTSIHDSVAWLVRLRWWAIVGVTIVLLLAHAADLIDSTAPSLVVVAVLAAANLIRARSLSGAEDADRQDLETSTLIYIHLDLLALTLLLHFTGGVDNPFAIFYVFHTTIAAILLGSFRPLLIGLSAVVMYGAVVLGQHYGLLPHHRLGASGLGTGESASLPVALGRLGALALSLFAIIYLVRTVVSQRKRSEALQRSHARLAQSRGRLARIGEISAGLAHSIRNPLHGALNCVQILRDNPKGADAEEALELLGEGLTRMKDVTNRLLVLTRDAPMRRVDSDLAEVVRDTVRFLQIRFRETGVEVHTELAETGTIPLDPDHFHEAFYNILDNAIAASRGHSGQVEVVTRPATGGRNGFEVIVRDRGPGIKPADMERIFDPFFTTKAIGEGSGLGLAIARRVIEAHGGTIAVESEIGVGTEIRMFLPSGTSERTAAATAP